MAKKFVMILVVLVLFVVAPVAALAANYVGNSNSGKFHYENCRAAKKISANYRVEFEDRDSAIEAGYKPCGICRP